MTNTTVAVSGAPFVEQSKYRNVVGHFATGVTIITTTLNGVPYGTTASAVTSLSMDPPMMLICLNKTSETQAAVLASGTFAVNILAEGQSQLAGQFARKGPNKFDGVSYDLGAGDAPLLTAALATMQCQTVETVTGGTHTVFLAHVLDADATDGEPLTYFRGTFGRLERAREAAAYLAVRDWVLARNIPTGDAIDEDMVAEQLDLDKPHVHGALIKLTSEYLVSRSSDGTFASTVISAETAASLFDARAAIEIGVVDAKIGNLDEVDLVELERLANDLATIVSEPLPDFNRFLAASHDYHSYLVGLTNCKQLTDAYQQLGISGLWRHAIADRDWWDLFDVRHHSELTAALRSGDRNAASAAIYQHRAQVNDLVHSIITASGGQL